MPGARKLGLVSLFSLALIASGPFTRFAAANQCPLSQGYWKTHAHAWPAQSLVLGNPANPAHFYRHNELLALLWTPPAGDASLILAHQLIAAKLNVAHGSNPSPIAAVLAFADAVMSLVPTPLPYRVGVASVYGQVLRKVASRLDAYNRGRLPGSCGSSNLPPMAQAGPDRTVALGARVTLDGSSSSDPDGDALTFHWSFFALPAGSTATLSDPAAMTPTFLVDRSGTYELQLVVHDGTSASAPDTVRISTENSPPVAHAGPDQTAFIGDTVQLDGGASNDADGDALTFAWTLLSRPPGSAATLNDPLAVRPALVPDLPGSYEMQLVVHDGQAASAPDTVLVTTENSAPVADAGPDQSVRVGMQVTLDGSGSTDVDGDALTYTWSLTTVPTGSLAALDDRAAVRPTFVVDLPGSYAAHLVVNDGTFSSAPDTVVVSTENAAPIADAGPDQTVSVGQVVTLDGTGSSDPDGDALFYQWSFTARPPGSTAVLTDETNVAPSFVADRPGTYVVQLVVSDAILTSAPATVTITTTNSAPVADAGPDQPAAPVGGVVALDGSGSRDADGDPLTYQWSLLSMPTGSTAVLSDPTLAAPTFLADLAGIYVAQLIVNDGQVASEPDTVTISTAALPVVTITALDDAAEAGPDAGTFEVARTGPATADLTVVYVIAGAATNGVDYQAISTSLIIPAGAQTATIAITPIDDGEIEGTESVVLSLAAAPGYVGGTPGIASLVIADDDLAIVSIVATDPDATEAGPASGAFTLARTGVPADPLTIVLTQSGTANQGADYVTLGGPSFAATIPAGQSSIVLMVVPFADNLVEETETVVLTIEPRLHYVVGDAASATVTIGDDPPIVVVTATDPEASEAGPDPGVLTFTRSGGNLAEALTVRASLGGTATNSSDYSFISGDQTIPANQASATKTVAPLADNRVEGVETFVLTIEPSATYLVGGSSTATVTIADDPARVTIVATDPDASESGPEPGAFTFTRSGGDPASVLNVFVTRSGSASNGGDYLSIGGTTFLVSIPANQTAATVAITPVDDAIVEGSETVVLTIQPNSAYLIVAPGAAIVTIADND